MRKLIAEGFVIFTSIIASFSVENYRESSQEKEITMFELSPNQVLSTLASRNKALKISSENISQESPQKISSENISPEISPESVFRKYFL